MHTDLHLSFSTVLAFFLVLARVGGAFVFVPMPGREAGPGMARIILALSCAFALFPRWPDLSGREATLGLVAVWLISELAIGISIGLVVAFLSEALTFGAQVMGLQAGYGYASVVDPTTQADSDVLAVMMQLIAGLLFFTAGLDRYVIRAFADSLDRYPPGAFLMTRDLAQLVIRLGSGIFTVGLRFAFPVLALLFMTEMVLALVGRVNSQLHVGMHAFPVKMLLTLAILSGVLATTPQLYERFATEAFQTLRHTLLP
jgi:flagellar biosynthetic protein FliR